MGFRFPNLNSQLRKTYKTLATPNSLLHDHRHRPLFLISSIDDHQNHSRIARRWHMGHAHHDHGHVRGDDGVFKLGLAADIALAAGKSVTGYLSGSTAIIADAAHSFSDIVLSGIAWLSFRAGKAPKDKEHPYGYS